MGLGMGNWCCVLGILRHDQAVNIEQYPELKRLSDEAKLELASELFTDVIGGSASGHSALLPLIESRLAEYRNHPEQTSTWDAVKSRLAEKGR